ncbi:MAG: 1,4-dihydroxy-2-naphthoate octaprenyltransferase [Bacteroidales bacterium]|nr:1,4-dihydroxy-2-naphthoate octaprenyltransferase [Bacteroidales bacterium]
MQKIKLWFGVCRPYSLFVSASPVLAGLLVLGYVPNIPVAVVTLLCAMSLQVFSNLVNDYYDFVRGCDKAGRSGPQRPLAEGIVNINQMRNACIVALSVSLLLGAYLIWVGGWVILIVGVLAVIFAWLYTATRFSLAYLGVADIVCFLFYGPVASAGTVYLQTATLPLEAVWVGCACGCIAVCVLASNNIRDIEEDRSVGKRTFPVRFGKTAALVGVATILLASVAFAVLGFRSWLMLVMIVPNVYLFIRLVRAQGKSYNKCLFSFVILDAFVVVLAVVAFVIEKYACSCLII